MKKILLLLSILTSLLIFSACTSQEKEITNFEECIIAGFPVMESYPQQCSDGKNTFTEEITEINTKFEDIKKECNILGNGAFWIDKSNECENAQQTWCEDNGGTFTSCGSPCRNTPEVELCTMNCAIFCTFN